MNSGDIYNFSAKENCMRQLPAFESIETEETCIEVCKFNSLRPGGSYETRIWPI